MSWNVRSAAEERMSTTSLNPNEGTVPSAGAARKQGPTMAGSRAGNLLGSQPLSQSSPHDRHHSQDGSDDDLITAAQRGDQQAFVELCRRHSTVTKKRIFRIVRNHEDTEDALQDTLLRAYTHLTSFRRSCKFSTWLTTIAVNSALMIMRKRRVRREINLAGNSPDLERVELPEPVDRSPGPEAVCLRKQAILLVRREVNKLK